MQIGVELRASIKADPWNRGGYHTLPLTFGGFTGHRAALRTWSSTFLWTGWPRATTTPRQPRSRELARILRRPADLMFPAWCSLVPRLLEKVICSQNREHRNLLNHIRSQRRTGLWIPACVHLHIQQAAPHQVSRPRHFTFEQMVSCFYARAAFLTIFPRFSSFRNQWLLLRV